jgi:hypothetical protein
MRLADMLHLFHKGRTLIIVKIVHDKGTPAETKDTATLWADELDALTYAEKYESEVLMFECPAPNTLKVWTYREK